MFVLLRRVDLADVIGSALVAKAAGAGARTIAAALGRPVDTVRGWLRRFEQRAEHVRVYFTVLLVDTGPDPIPPAASVSVFANAVSAVVGAWKAAASSWLDIGEVSPWQLAAATSRGRLALTLIHTTSRGYPQAVNNLSLQALVAAFATGKNLVDEAAARASVSEVVGD
ncbi:hypothetical protein AAH978_21565 [Streptomyces sp. ZYX-F-203]